MQQVRPSQPRVHHALGDRKPHREQSRKAKQGRDQGRTRHLTLLDQSADTEEQHEPEKNRKDRPCQLDHPNTALKRAVSESGL